MNNACLSLVENRKRPTTLMVRSRLPDDINRVFPDAVVWETPDADYRYRAVVNRSEAEREIALAVGGIDYSNFKDSVSEEDRHDAYMRVWSDLMDLQPFAKRPTIPAAVLVRAIDGDAQSVIPLADYQADPTPWELISRNPSDFAGAF